MFPKINKKKVEVTESCYQNWSGSVLKEGDTLQIPIVSPFNPQRLTIENFKIDISSNLFPFDQDPAFIISEPRRIDGANDMCIISTNEEKKFIVLPHTFIPIKTIQLKDGTIMFEVSDSWTKCLSNKLNMGIYVQGIYYPIKKWDWKNSSIITIQWNNGANGLWSILDTITLLDSAFIYIEQPKNMMEWIRYINESIKQMNGYYILNNMKPKIIDKIEHLYLQDIEGNKICISEDGNISENIGCKVSFAPSLLLDSIDDSVWTVNNLENKWSSWNLQRKTNIEMEIWLENKPYKLPNDICKEMNNCFLYPLFNEKKIMVFDKEEFSIPIGYHTIQDVKEFLNQFLFSKFGNSISFHFDYKERFWVLECQKPIPIYLGTLGAWMNFTINSSEPFIGTKLESKKMNSFLFFRDPFKTEGKNLKNLIPFFLDSKQTYKKYLIHPGYFQHLYQIQYNENNDKFIFNRKWSKWNYFTEDLSFQSLFPQLTNLSFSMFIQFQINLKSENSIFLDTFFSLQTPFFPNMFTSHSKESIPFVSKWLNNIPHVYVSILGFEKLSQSKPLSFQQQNNHSWDDTNFLKLKQSKNMSNHYQLDKKSIDIIFQKIRNAKLDTLSIQLLNHFGQIIHLDKTFFNVSFNLFS